MKTKLGLSALLITIGGLPSFASSESVTADFNRAIAWARSDGFSDQQATSLATSGWVLAVSALCGDSYVSASLARDIVSSSAKHSGIPEERFYRKVVEASDIIVKPNMATGGATMEFCNSSKEMMSKAEAQ